MDDLRKRLEEIRNAEYGINPQKPSEEDIAKEEAEEILNLDEETPSEEVNYKNLIIDDMNNMSDEEFNESRRMAYESIKDEITEPKEEKEHEEVVADEQPKKTAAEIYEEKHTIIKRTPKPNNTEKEEDYGPDSGSDLINQVSEIDKNSAQMSEMLHAMQDQYNKEREQPVSDDSDDIGNESIDDIIESIEASNKASSLNVEETDDLDTIIEKFEKEKYYAKYDTVKDVVGPVDYVVTKSDDYEDAVEDVLASNNYQIIKKSNKEKFAILDKFTNKGDEVTVPLINSGIFVTFTGASTTEIIEMNQMTGESDSHLELNKLNIVSNHIVGSSIGRMKLSQLIKVVSCYDKESLYYGLYAATYPESEISRGCSACGSEYFFKFSPRDLLINPEDYVEDAKDIRENITTYDILREKSKLNKVYKKLCDNGNIIIFFKHASIESYIHTLSALSSETRDKYGNFFEVVFGIEKLLLRESNNNYIEFTDPNEILEVINRVKNPDVKYEIYDMLEEIRPNAIPIYGYRTTVCPHCGFKESPQSFSMQDILFTQASEEERNATLRWASRMQKRKQQSNKK